MTLGKKGYSRAIVAVAFAFVGVEVVADVYRSDPGKKIRSYLPTVWHVYHVRTYDVQPLYRAGRGKFGTRAA